LSFSKRNRSKKRDRLVFSGQKSHLKYSTISTPDEVKNGETPPYASGIGGLLGAPGFDKEIFEAIREI